MSKNAKRYLMLLAAVGLIAVVAGGSSGTFASFNAQVSNQGNYFATGTLFLHQKSIANDICRSEDNSGNLNTSCTYHVTKTAAKPGDTVQMKVALTNAGTINASGLTVGVSCAHPSPVVAKTASDYSAQVASTITSLSLSNMTQTIYANTDIIVGGVTFTVTADAVPSSGSATATVTSTSGSNGPASGANVSMSAFGTNNLCNTDLQFTIQEMTSNTYASQATCYFPTSTSCATGDTWTAFNTAANPMSIGTLTAGTTRYFMISVTLPSGAGNASQNAEADFNVDWLASQ